LPISSTCLGYSRQEQFSQASRSSERFPDNIVFLPHPHQAEREDYRTIEGA
jgi:hypothetical protein